MTSSIFTSIVFPGQGVQRPGMGQEFYDNFPAAKAAYEEASEACGLDMASLCFAADDQRLNLTEFAQPAILCTEIAMWRVAQQELGLKADECLFAGHSLGEYSALVAAEALPLGTAASLVRERGRLMQEAAPVGSGAMLAVISEQLDFDLIHAVIQNLSVDIANDNSSQQVVLSGTANDLQTAQTQLSEQLNLADASAWRFVPLAVSAPFHSRFMAGIEATFEAHLIQHRDEIQIEHAIRVASNYSGGLHTASFTSICHKLVKQISGTVRWRDNMQYLANAGAPIIEIGPGKPLRGFFKTIGTDIQSVINLRSLNRLSNHIASAA